MDTLSEDLFDSFMRTESNRKSDGYEPEKSNSPPKHNVDSDEIGDGYKKIFELTDEDIRALEFDSKEDGFVFYREYAKFIGFAVRKHDVYRDRNDVITMRQFVCNKEGERSVKHLNRTDRKREAKAITRTKCNARLRIHLDYKSRKWIVGCFEPAHNHELTPARINSFIKRYVQSKNSLVDFLHNFDRVVNEYRHNELTSDFKSTYTQPVMTTALEKYEVEASNLYTRNKFFDVRKEIEKVVAINVIDRSDVDNVVRMKMNKFGNPDVENVVQLDKSNGNLICDCRLFESCGIPCSHILCAMKHEQMESILASLICKRWTRLAKVDHISAVYVEEGDTSKKELLRSGAVGAACNRLNKAARKNPHNFVKNIESIHKLAEQMEREEGHTVRTCKKYATRDQLDTVLEEQSSIETDEESRDQSLSVNPRYSQDLNDVSVSADHNFASDKGQSKKKRKRNEGVKHNEAVKLTQESVNEVRSSDVNTTHEAGMRSKISTKSDFNVNQMRTPSLFDNHVYVSNMNAPSMSGSVHFRPSMIHGFGEGLNANRFQYMSQYPQMYM
ncbi:Zinc finger, PMZ-type [Sesbania bispinosa]|nr:Zinc finger, PMZ-type [Sesbania bispinosa]